MLQVNLVDINSIKNDEMEYTAEIKKTGLIISKSNNQASILE